MDNLCERFQGSTGVQVLQFHMLCMNKTFEQ